MKEDRGGSGDVKGVDLVRHGKVGEMVAEVFGFFRETKVFGSEKETAGLVELREIGKRNCFGG